MQVCESALNKCKLPAYMPNLKGSTRVGKTDSTWHRNFLGLLIWKHMTGEMWVKTTSLDPDKSGQNVVEFEGFENHLRLQDPKLMKQMIGNVRINYSGLESFCTNTKHLHRKEGTWNAKSTSKNGLFEPHYKLMRRCGFPFVEE